MVVLEWHSADRVLRQFGYAQHIPQTPVALDRHHSADQRGYGGLDWRQKRWRWRSLWASRQQYLAGWTLDTHPHHVASFSYYNWYWYMAQPVLRIATWAQPPAPPLQVPVGIIPFIDVHGQYFDFPPPQPSKRSRKCFPATAPIGRVGIPVESSDSSASDESDEDDDGDGGDDDDDGADAGRYLLSRSRGRGSRGSGSGSRGSRGSGSGSRGRGGSRGGSSGSGSRGGLGGSSGSRGGLGGSSSSRGGGGSYSGSRGRGGGSMGSIGGGGGGSYSGSTGGGGRGGGEVVSRQEVYIPCMELPEQHIYTGSGSCGGGRVDDGPVYDDEDMLDTSCLDERAGVATFTGLLHSGGQGDQFEQFSLEQYSVPGPSAFQHDQGSGVPSARSHPHTGDTIPQPGIFQPTPVSVYPPGDYVMAWDPQFQPRRPVARPVPRPVDVSLGYSTPPPQSMFGTTPEPPASHVGYDLGRGHRRIFFQGPCHMRGCCTPTPHHHDI